MKRLLMFGVLGLAAAALVACGDDDDDDVGEANAAFCDDLAAYGTAVADLAALDPATATKSDYDSAADDVRKRAGTRVDSRTGRHPARPAPGRTR